MTEQLNRDEQKDLMKAAWREAHKEWLDEQMAKFGRWSAHTVFSAAMLAEQLDSLVEQYGELRVPTDDGREITFSELRAELQQQRNEADSFGKLHEIAAACAARNGG